MESGPGVPGLGPSGFVGSTGRTGFFLDRDFLDLLDPSHLCLG